MISRIFMVSKSKYANSVFAQLLFPAWRRLPYVGAALAADQLSGARTFSDSCLKSLHLHFGKLGKYAYRVQKRFIFTISWSGCRWHGPAFDNTCANDEWLPFPLPSASTIFIVNCPDQCSLVKSGAIQTFQLIHH